MSETDKTRTVVGTTTLADLAVSRTAAVAALEVDGVYAVGSTGPARALRERIPGSRTNSQPGVTVEVGERQAAFDIEIVTDYGLRIADLAGRVRRSVIDMIERTTGLEVTEVNVTVVDVHVPEGTGPEHGRRVRKVPSAPLAELAPPDDPVALATEIAAAAAAVPGVVELSSGPGNDIATDADNHRIVGVRFGPTGVDVHVLAALGHHLEHLGDLVRAQIREQVAGLDDRPVSVCIDDVKEQQ